MTDINTLILAGDGYKLSVSPTAIEQKAELITMASKIETVKSPDESISARDLLKRLSAMRNLVEKSRKAVKEPVIKVGKDIDQTAADFMVELQAEEKRVKDLIAVYAEEVAREQERQRREAEEKRRAEEKAAREAEEARIAAEKKAEEARIAAEKAEWEEGEEAKAAAAKAQAEAAEQARLAEETAAKAKEAEQVAVVIAPIEAPKGVKFEMDFEVADIGLLYGAKPHLVKVEPKRADILAFIRSMDPESPTLESDMAKIGLKVIRKAKVSTR